jgi:hypothetical protein
VRYGISAALFAALALWAGATPAQEPAKDAPKASPKSNLITAPILTDTGQSFTPNIRDREEPGLE